MRRLADTSDRIVSKAQKMVIWKQIENFHLCIAVRVDRLLAEAKKNNVRTERRDAVIGKGCAVLVICRASQSESGPVVNLFYQSCDRIEKNQSKRRDVCDGMVSIDRQ